jgi:hypothetical protein
MNYRNHILTLLLLASYVTLFGQTGKIKGQVIDRQEKLGLAFAIVTLVDTKAKTSIDSLHSGTYYSMTLIKSDTGITYYYDAKFQNITDSNGFFSIDSIPPGTYSLISQYAGKGDTTITNIIITSDTTVIVKMNLPPICEYEKHKDDMTCPICKRRGMVIPIVYGLPMNPDPSNYYYAGCIASFCEPNWYCKRCKQKF